MRTGRPGKEGLYLPDFEHDNCGIGFVAHIKGRKSHSIIKMGLEVLRNMLIVEQRVRMQKQGMVPVSSYRSLAISI